MNKELAKQQIEILINKFAEKEKFYKDKSHSKESIKVEFITPFFRALGWDIENKQSREVIFEDRTRIEGRIKRPDYGFYLNDKRQFFLEAKAAHEDLKNNWEHAYQLKSYGWSSKLKISILTDFEELAIYDCRYYPEKLAETSKHRIKYLNYKNYLKEFDFLWDNLSREAVLNGSLNRLVKDVKNIEKEAVDKKFLDFLEEERIRLAGEIAKLNPTIGQFELNKALVKLINRIVFLRIAEDRDIEKYGELQELVARSKKEKALESLSEIKEKPKVQNLELIYPELKILFAKANEKYNSEMFELDKTDLELHIKDQVLYHFIENLYYPNSPYIFDAISIDVLGSTYERFLGSVVVLSSLHEAIVEQKPEVRKAGGVYYTPEYIVDYIVENTVGELIKNKTPEEVSKIKILDPACGSGSFLIGVYEYLLDWHLKYYEKASLKEQKDNIDFVEGKPRLTIKLKKQILLNNIFGVDIDEQAINVTKLSLCLKCLEGETQHSLRNQLALFKTQALPTLKDNIKCGNSLINTNFSLFNEEYNDYTQDEKLKINLFDWDSIKYGFGNITKQGGFDIIIGNPPYVRMQNLDKSQVTYFNELYEVAYKNYDIYILFVEQVLRLIKQSGFISFIMPHKFIKTDYGEKLKNLICENSLLSEFIDFTDLQVFDQATTYTGIFTFTKSKKTEFSYLKITNDQEKITINSIKKREIVNYKNLASNRWILEADTFNSLFVKLEKLPKLSEFTEKIFQGLVTSADAVYILESKNGKLYSKYTNKEYDFDYDIIKPLLKGAEIKRYSQPEIKFKIIFPYKIENDQAKLLSQKELEKQYPEIWNYFIECKEKLTGRENGKMDIPEWWIFGRTQNLNCFYKPKIMTQVLSLHSSLTYDPNGFYYFVGGGTAGGYGVVLKNNSELDYKYLLGLLNSRLLEWFIHSYASPFRGGYFAYNKDSMGHLPIIKISIKEQETIIKLVDEILDLNEQKKTASEYQIQRILQPQIDETDKAIDKLVYDLYGLTDDEIKIVEGMG